MRFINIYHEGWDAHSDLNGNHRQNAATTDQGVGRLGSGSQAARPAGRDAGDLGRRVRPYADGRKPSRPPAAASAAITIRRRSRCGWPAAASSRALYGATDDLGFHVVENPVHVHDLQATILYLLGLRSRTAHVPVLRPRFPAHRRQRPGRPPDFGLMTRQFWPSCPQKNG